MHLNYLYVSTCRLLASPGVSIRRIRIESELQSAVPRYLGASPSLVYAYVERKQIPHYRMMGRSIRFRVPELAERRQQFHVNGGIDEQQDR